MTTRPTKPTLLDVLNTANPLSKVALRSMTSWVAVHDRITQLKSPDLVLDMLAHELKSEKLRPYVCQRLLARYNNLSNKRSTHELSQIITSSSRG